jgi:hypothetical protein
MPRSTKRTDIRQEVWLPKTIIRIYDQQAKRTKASGRQSRKAVMENLLINSAKVLGGIFKKEAKAKKLRNSEL